MDSPGEGGLETCQEPCIFPGCIANWPAMRLWKGPSGIQHLSTIAGSAIVQVMVAPVLGFDEFTFGGDMEHLQLLETTLSAVLNGGIVSELEAAQGALGDAARSLPPHCIYLAQCPIASPPRFGSTLTPEPLHRLEADIIVPEFVPRGRLSQINFWASPMGPMRSSLHYDPYCNLLAVVSGKKVVRLAPPSSSPLLSLRPAYDESANHARSDLWSMNEAARKAAAVEEFIVGPGDALFIPEGWLHQVESAAGTLAVNFWWESADNLQFGSKLDMYYLRRVARSLTEGVRRRILEGACKKAAMHLGGAFITGTSRNGVQWHGAQDSTDLLELRNGLICLRSDLSELETSLLEYLAACVSADGAPAQQGSKIERSLLALLHQGASSFMRVLLALRNASPHSIAALLKGMTPLGWEALTAGLERAVATAAYAPSAPPDIDDFLSSFYENIYSCVEDRHALTMAMLEAKHAVARSAMHIALEEALGLDL